VSVLGAAGVVVGREPAQAEPLAAALLDGELRHRGEILPVQLHRRDQVHRVGPGLGDDAVGHPLDPGHAQAVPEADDQLHAHRDVTAQPLHDADELRGAAIARRHEVDDPRRAVGGLEARCGVEARQAQPVHRAVAADQGGRLQVTISA